MNSRKIPSISKQAGFTLIEFATVLVTIIIIIGAILKANELVSGAEIKNTISQVERYNSAARTFSIKYGYLPGDIPNPVASQFGFQSRETSPGQGDGDGIIQGFNGDGKKYGWMQCGEPLMFWIDLSKAGVIQSNFSSASTDKCSEKDIVENFEKYYPSAGIGKNTYFYVASIYSSAKSDDYNLNSSFSGINMFVISQIHKIAFESQNGEIIGGKGISVYDAYSIDKKIDDGIPTSGHVITASSLDGGFSFSNNDVNMLKDGNKLPSENAVPNSKTSCYDNDNKAGEQVKYSTEYNGSKKNCSLAIKFK
ncbi:MAG: hypothetical protein WCJ33_04450 [Pseudomonadota bacterium]